MLENFLAIISSNISLGPFFLFSPSRTPIMQMLVHLMLPQRSLRLSSFLFILFLYSALWQWFPSVSQVTYLFFCLSYSDVDSFSYIIHLCLFFSSSRSLVNFSCIFSIFASILFPRSWIIFTMIILNSFYGRLPVSTSLSCFSGVLSCPFIWDITFCFSSWFTFHNVIF